MIYLCNTLGRIDGNATIVSEVERAETDFNLERKELFHIPYDKREYASSERFSVAGYPCLYLSSQYEICWCECHKPKKFALAAFEVPQTRDDMAKVVTSEKR